MKLPSVLPAPERPVVLPHHANWLAGEGAGSWFTVESEGSGLYAVKRYSPLGRLECAGLFGAGEVFSLSKGYEVEFPAHCAEVTLKIQGKCITLMRMSDY